MQPTTLTFITLLALIAPPGRTAALAERPHIKHCLVSLIDDVEVAAQEAGLLMSVAVKEGHQVKRDDLLAQIDDRRAHLQKEAAQVELRAAQERANDDIEVRYSQAAFKVAEAEYLNSLKVNAQVKGAISQAELSRLELTQHRSELQIDRSKLELRVARMTAEVNQAQVKAAEEDIHRRQITSPIDGIVVSIFRQAGEWVNPGETVLRVVRMDRLRIEGFLSAAKYDPAEIDKQPVTVYVLLAGGNKAQFTGKVVFVSPLVQAGNKFLVRADVDNRKVKGHWQLRPGMSVEMKIGK